jgi:ubiquinone/menaquinone biosynthesis C-methylase UbiE
MNKAANIVSDWTRRVESGQTPSSVDLLDHLAVIHKNNAGFTETCAWKCRDTNGKNSYDLLSDMIDETRHFNILDLGCGSGVLLDLCHQRFNNSIKYTGVDISSAELKLARSRLAHTDVRLFQGLAQNLNFIEDSSMDAILCHWALTLMDPIIPVLNSIKRVLKKNGMFAAIIDGDMGKAPGYDKINKIIYKHAQQEYPEYGKLELGDSRIRTAKGAQELMEEIFINYNIKVRSVLLSLIAKPPILARETAGFFYASFVIPPTIYNDMLSELENYFASTQKNGAGCFFMPVNFLTIHQN